MLVGQGGGSSVKIAWVFVAVIDCALVSIPARADDAKNNLVAVANAVRGEIVQVLVPLENGKESEGSGFWINDNGYVATCWHVVQQHPETTVQINSSVDPLIDLQNHTVINAGWMTFTGKVVAHDANNDIALLKVEPNPFKTPTPAPMNILGRELKAHYKQAVIDAGLPAVGETILLAGYPLGLPYPVVQQGTVASVATDLPQWGHTIKILLSMVANHRSSGGPVFNSQSKVIGLFEGEPGPGAPGGEGERTGIEVVVPAYFLSVLMGTIH
jgi:S1-C subfamily serine protease